MPPQKGVKTDLFYTENTPFGGVKWVQNRPLLAHLGKQVPRKDPPYMIKMQGGVPLLLGGRAPFFWTILVQNIPLLNMV
jgi:hypothetical protein